MWMRFRRGSGATFAAGTNVDLAEDYGLAKAVLDRMVASLTFEHR
jgi:hypothetical protein